HCHWIQREVIHERADVARLLTDDLRTCILKDAWSVRAGLGLGPNKIFNGLTDAPDARVSFARSSEELCDFRSQGRRVEQRPHLIEHSDAGLSSFSAG